MDASSVNADERRRKEKFWGRGAEISDVRILGHRGAPLAHPENTVEAFAAAIALGADGVELDVRRTADGRLAVCHDPVLPDGRVLAELQAAELPPSVPDLAAAVAACGGSLVNVEIKNLPDEPDFDPGERVAEAVVAFVHEHDLADRVVVSSFWRGALDRVAALDPAIRRGWLTLPTWDQQRALDRVVADGHHVLHPHHLAVNAELVAAAHAAGVAVTTWTVDDPDRMRWLAGCGVDAIITNAPDVAVAALRG